MGNIIFEAKQDQQMQQVYNYNNPNEMDKEYIDASLYGQMQQQYRQDIEQQYLQQQQNYFFHQMNSINDFYNHLNIKNSYDPSNYQFHCAPRRIVSPHAVGERKFIDRPLYHQQQQGYQYVPSRTDIFNNQHFEFQNLQQYPNLQQSQELERGRLQPIDHRQRENQQMEAINQNVPNNYEKELILLPNEQNQKTYPSQHLDQDKEKIIQRRVLDYDEIFNVSSMQGENNSMMTGTQFLETEYDRQLISTKYHQDNLKQTNGFQQNIQRQANSGDSGNSSNLVRDFDDVPISSMGATKNFEELVEQELKRNGISTETNRNKGESDQKVRKDVRSSKDQKDRNKSESPQRFLKQGSGLGGRISSIASKKKKEVKPMKMMVDENKQFLMFEEILDKIQGEKAQLSVEDILRIKKEEQEIVEIRGEKVRTEDIEIDSKLEKILVTKYLNDKIKDLNHFIQKLQDNYQKARAFKQAYQDNMRKFEIQQATFQEKMAKEKNEFEEYKTEQKKQLEAEQRLLKKQQREKNKHVDTEEDSKSLMRYKEEAKTLRDQLNAHKFDSKNKIEEIQLSLSITMKENKNLRKEVNQQKRLLEQCQDLKYIVSPPDIQEPSKQTEQELSSLRPQEAQSVRSYESQSLRPQEVQSVRHIEGQSIKPQEGQSLRPMEGQSVRPQEGQSIRPQEGQNVRPQEGQSVRPQQVSSQGPKQVSSQGPKQVSSQGPNEFSTRRPNEVPKVIR